MGACANAPMCAINDYYYEDLTPESLDALITAFAAGEPPRTRLGHRPPGQRARKASRSP